METIQIHSREEAIVQLGKLGRHAWDNGEPCPVDGYIFVRRPACPERLQWPQSAVLSDRINEAARRAWCVEHLDDGGRAVIASDYPELMPLVEQATQQLLSAECRSENKDGFYFSGGDHGLYFAHMRRGCESRSVCVKPEDESRLLDVLIKRSQRRFVELRPISEYPESNEWKGRALVVLYESELSDTGVEVLVSHGAYTDPDGTDFAFFELDPGTREWFKAEGSEGE